MNIRNAHISEVDWLKSKDDHISEEVISQAIKDQRIIVIENSSNDLLGFLRYGFFWDTIPFINLLWIEPFERRKGIGRLLTSHWHKQMKDQGFLQVLTSSLSNEEAQHFYRRLGYIDCGSLFLPDEPAEILFRKKLDVL